MRERAEWSKRTLRRSQGSFGNTLSGGNPYRAKAYSRAADRLAALAVPDSSASRRGVSESGLAVGTSVARNGIFCCRDGRVKIGIKDPGVSRDQNYGTTPAKIRAETAYLRSTTISTVR